MALVALPPEIVAAANPKSSTGRLDVFTRVIADRSRAFDIVPAGYAGKLYLEISPRTFPILVREGSRLSQIRFRQGASLATDALIREPLDSASKTVSATVTISPRLHEDADPATEALLRSAGDGRVTA